MNTPVYTGVGSRSTPEETCKTFTYLGADLGSRGWRLRSGHADGPDMAFETGSPLWLGSDAYHGVLGREVYLPWKKFNGRRRHFDPFVEDPTGNSEDEGYYVPDAHWPTYRKAEEIAQSVIPWWDKLKPSYKRLHTRNVYQVLGFNLDTPSDLLICNADLDKHGEPTGGTRTAIKIAEKYKVPVINRQYYSTDDELIEAVLNFAIKWGKGEAIKESSVDGTDNDTQSQGPDETKVVSADRGDRGAVAGSAEDTAEDGSGAIDE